VHNLTDAMASDPTDSTIQDPRPDEVRRLLHQLRRLSRALDVQSRRIDREMGLTLPQFLVLRLIGEMGEVTGRAISAAADLSPPTVVGVLDKLAAKGLIDRYRSARDRRIVHARLTERGEAALAAAPDPLGTALRGGFAAMAPQDRADLLAAMERLGALAGPAEDAAG
jgi:DNA-binding MarR family transcriptional regulator